jgi:hypothetical protein
MDSNHYDCKKLDKLIEDSKISVYDVADAIQKDYMTVYRARKGLGVSYEVLADILAYFREPTTDFIYPEPKKNNLKKISSVS